MRAARILLLGVLATLPVGAVEFDHGPGESSYKFLKLPLSPRIVALGGAGAGLADDAASLDINPAAAASDSQHLVLGHGYPFSQFLGTSSHITWSIPLESGYRVLLNARYLGFDDIDGWSDQGEATSAYGAHTYKMQAGAAGNWRGLLWGATFNFAGNNVASANYVAAMVNAGARYLLPFGFMAGASVVNADFWGSKSKDAAFADPFPPATAQVGLAYTHAFGSSWKASVAADARARNDEDAAFPAGVEIGWRDMLIARAGFPFGEPEPGFSAGIGLHWSLFRLEYAFQSHATLGPGHYWALDLAY